MTDNHVFANREHQPGIAHILYVEDDADTRAATGIVLREAGFAVHEAASAVGALDDPSVREGLLDILIVDYHLGDGMTGTEVAEVIGRKLGHGVPTIIMTGDPANAEVPWLSNSPVWLIRKPICPSSLVAGIGPLIEFRRAMARARASSSGRRI